MKSDNSRMIENICSYFKCEATAVTDFRQIKGGLTNHSYFFRVAGCDYIYRHPGEGTEFIINRRNEKVALEKAHELGIEPTYVYMDAAKGWKISRYVPSFREPEYGDEADWDKILPVLRYLHGSGVELDFGMKPWEDSLATEALLRKKDPTCFEPYEKLKATIGRLYERTLGDGVRKCFCQGDTFKHNWMLLPSGEVILIDWEYAGYSDPGIDVGYYIVDAEYDLQQAKRFIAAYLQGNVTPELEFHYLAYTAIIAYYWFVWALYRESCGADIGESLDIWRDMAEKYGNILINS